MDPAGAASALVRALRLRGADARVDDTQTGEGHVVVQWPSGKRTRFVAVPASKLSGPNPALDAVLRDTAGRDRDPVPVVVADLITEASRSALASSGLSWLDRRGHLNIRTDDMWIDAQVPPDPRTTTPSRRQLVSGPAQISVAAAFLAGLRPGVRELGRRVGLSAASISTARTGLVESGLLSADGNPAVPDLFWALADAWTVNWVDLAAVPPVDDRLVLVGSGPAARLGAPIVVTADWPVELLGRDAATVDRARLRAGPATGTPACRVGLAPTPLVADEELVTGHHESGFPIGHPLFVALELAQDPARGAEALELWDPKGFERVW